MPSDIFHLKTTTMELKIKKAKLTKSGSVDATYIDKDGNEITIKGNHRAHVDLRSRLQELVPFFTELTEQKEADHIDWDAPHSEANNELLKQISVTAVSKGGDDSAPFIVMTGKRILLTRKVLNLCSPGVDLGDESLVHGDEFDMAVQAFLYLRSSNISSTVSMTPTECLTSTRTTHPAIRKTHSARLEPQSM